LLAFPKAKAAGALVLLLAVSAATVALPPELQLNGSINYIPCLIALLLVAWKGRQPQLYQAGLLFACSLTFRSVDMALCEQFPNGTHFLWHLLNGWLLYMLVHILIIHCKPSQRV
jgi:hypothetical protein